MSTWWAAVTGGLAGGLVSYAMPRVLQWRRRHAADRDTAVADVCAAPLTQADQQRSLIGRVREVLADVTVVDLDEGATVVVANKLLSAGVGQWVHLTEHADGTWSAT